MNLSIELLIDFKDTEVEPERLVRSTVVNRCSDFKVNDIGLFQLKSVTPTLSTTSDIRGITQFKARAEIQGSLFHIQSRISGFFEFFQVFVQKSMGLFLTCTKPYDTCNKKRFFEKSPRCGGLVQARLFLGLDIRGLTLLKS